jgi:hypothetical protein
MHLAGEEATGRQGGRGCSKVITAAEAHFPEEEAAGRERGALEARLENAERHCEKLQKKLLKQAQYSFARFNALRTEYEWGQKLYQNARANAKEGVETIEWQPSNESKDLAGFGYDEMYEDLRNDGEGSMSDLSDGHMSPNSQDTSRASSQGSVASGAGSTMSGSFGFIQSKKKPKKKKRRKEKRDRDWEPSQEY